MKVAIHQFKIELFENVFALWKRCEGVGLSDADARQSIQAYLDRNPGMSFIANEYKQKASTGLLRRR